MKPIRDIKDIENLKTDEKLIECLNGEVNYYRLWINIHSMSFRKENWKI